jgi:ribosomal protein L21E
MSPEVEDGVDEDEDEDMVILDTAGIWEIIRDWIAGTLHYETLLRHIDFQYEKYAELQYWEDFISDLAFESSVEKREAHFNSITLDQHRHSLSQYPPPAIPLQMSSPSPLQSPARISTPLDSAEVVSMWTVKILPGEQTFPKPLKRSDSIQVSSAPYILASWNRVGLSAMPQHKLLPGRVTVCAADPNTFLREVPKSHFGCVKAWSLVPVEDRINLFGAVEPSVPGWYTISKRGLYKGHIGYALFYDGDAGLLDLLVASRRLGDPTRRRADGSIGQDQRAPRLFLPGPHKGTRQPPHRGRTCYEYKGDTYVSGLLLISLKISEVQPLAIPSPHQIALHVQSGVDPVFMTASHHLYNQQFWKEHDSVVVCDAAHRGKRGVLQTISLETRSATVQLLEGGEWFIALSDLQRYYTAGDVVRIIEDPHSNIQNVHHQVIGKFGNVIDVDVDTGEVTLLDSTSSEEVRRYY